MDWYIVLAHFEFINGRILYKILNRLALFLYTRSLYEFKFKVESTSIPRYLYEWVWVTVLCAKVIFKWSGCIDRRLDVPNIIVSVFPFPRLSMSSLCVHQCIMCSMSAESLDSIMRVQLWIPVVLHLILFLHAIEHFPFELV